MRCSVGYALNIGFEEGLPWAPCSVYSVADEEAGDCADMQVLWIEVRKEEGGII